MSFFSYLESIVGVCGVAVIVLGLPWVVLRSYHLELPRCFLLTSVMGLYSTLVYLKPAPVPLWLIPLVLAIFSLVFWRARIIGTLREFFNPLRSLPTLVIIAYSFLLFVFRWEPPGSDPIKWGSLARIIYETGLIPGDTRPLTAVTDLKGASLGLPILISIFHSFQWVPLERVINFFECSSLCLFTFCLADGISLWFDRKVALWASLMSLTFFTQPQQYLAWGGTPTLVGMTAGFFALRFLRSLGLSRPGHFEILAYALAFVFAAHAHPIGFYIAGWVCLPVILNHLWISATWKKVWVPLSILVLEFCILFLPFFLHWGLDTTPKEIAIVRNWQREMSPFLFRAGHSYLYNLYTQVTTYVWNTAALFCLILFIVYCFVERKRSLVVPVVGMAAVITLLIANVEWWILPMSFLLYPERCATLFVFPLALLLAWLVSSLNVYRHRMSRLLIGTGISVVAILSLRQFHRRIYPHLFHSRMTSQDREAIAYVSAQVPKNKCVRITMHEAGMWIPVLAFRCTVPFHGLAINTIDQEQSKSREACWRYYSYLEHKPSKTDEGEVGFDNGARVVRLNSCRAEYSRGSLGQPNG